MEMNFNEECFKTPCPKVNCKKKPCCCGLRFVSVPAVLTDEVKPEKGAYSNAIVKYESTGKVYIYSAEGIPVEISSSQECEEYENVNGKLM